MRWKTGRAGETRIKTFFAWLPVEVNHEVRWLEYVTVEQEYTCGCEDSPYWKDIKFID